MGTSDEEFASPSYALVEMNIHRVWYHTSLSPSLIEFNWFGAFTTGVLVMWPWVDLDISIAY